MFHSDLNSGSEVAPTKRIKDHLDENHIVRAILGNGTYPDATEDRCHVVQFRS